MIECITDILSIWDGIVRNDVIYLLAGSDQLTAERIPHTVLIEYTTKPLQVITLDWTARDIAPDPEHCNGVIIIGLQGELARFRNGQLELLPPITNLDSPRGTLLFIGIVDGQLMACGGNQQIYRNAGGNEWITFEDGLVFPPDKGLSQFEFIVGDRRNGEFYTGGARGEAWRFNNQTWQLLDLPINARLVAATRGPDGKWWFCGQLGLLIHGSGNVWEVLHQDEGISYFWDLCFLGDRLFLTTDRVLYEWQNGELSPVNFADTTIYEGEIPYSFFKLMVDNNHLYSFGAKDVLSFNGSSWQRVF